MLQIAFDLLARNAHSIPLAVEAAHHGILPPIQAVKAASASRSEDVSRIGILKRAARQSAVPVALGASFIGAHFALHSRIEAFPTPQNTRITGHDVFHLTAAAALGFVNGVLEVLRPDLMPTHTHQRSHPQSQGHHLHGHDHFEHSCGGKGPAPLRQTLTNGFRHAGIHVLIDLKLLTLLKVFFPHGHALSEGARAH
jgi:hypothetical protein